MKSNREIRAAAWKIVRSRWFGRIFAVGGILYLVSIAVSAAVFVAFGDLNIQTWSDFLRAKLAAAQQGLGYDVPSSAAFWRMTGASLFQQFLGYLFGAIALFGLATVMLKAVRDDAHEWFGASFGGFRHPFAVLGLLVLMNLLVFLWSLLFLVPGLIAIYRYRQAWYLKSEHPDWGAVRCLRESGRMMKGYKGRAFGLDVSYAGWLLLCGLAFLSAAGFGLGTFESSGPLQAFLVSLLGLAGFYAAAFILCYFFVGRTVFYEELACARARDML